MQAGVDFAAINLNPANYVTQARPLPNYASENLDSDTLKSNYNALQVQVRHNAGKLNAEVNYTWSHEIDDMVNVFSGFSDPYDPSKDRGPGDWDIRHNITGSLVYSLPDLKQSKYAASRSLRRLAGIKHCAGSFGRPSQCHHRKRILWPAGTAQPDRSTNPAPQFFLAAAQL